MKSPYFNSEHDLFRQSVRQFIENEVAPHANEWEENQEIPRYIWKRMGELGYLGLVYPEKYGGAAADFFYSVIFTEEISRSWMGGFCAAVGVHSYMATAHIANAGSELLKQKYLVPAILGEKIGALAISEPGAGSDVANIRTTAQREGEYYVINGSKTFITNGVYSDFAVVACKTNPSAGAAGISLIVVDRNTPGFTANKLKKMGWNSSDTGELFFDNVRVPVENLVGQENNGFYYIMDSFQLERLITAIGSVAAADIGLELTLKYISEREAFGRKVNKFQTIRHSMADIATEIEAAKQFTYYTAWLYDQGEFAVKECSMIKLLNCELAKKAADICLQCFGGYGYMEEFPIARMYRDARVGTIAGGTSQIMREIISKIIIDDVTYRPAYNEEIKPPQESDKTERVIAHLTEEMPVTIESNSQTQNNQQKQNLNIMSTTPQTAREIVLSLSDRLKTYKVAPDYQTIVHFDLLGDNGGKFTVNIENGVCTVQEGHIGTPKCVITAKDRDYEDIELGRANPQMAVLMGKIKLTNMGEMMTFSGLFKRLY